MGYLLMSDSGNNSQMTLEVAWKMQDKYAKARLVWQLAGLISSSIHGVISNLLSSSLTTCNWSGEEEVRIKKIATELESIHEQMKHVEHLSLPLITIYKR